MGDVFGWQDAMRVDHGERSLCYDKYGNPIGMEEWGRLHSVESYMRIGSDYISDLLWVSTVWLGIDHNFSRTGPPIIFETMVYVSHGDPVFTNRYATEEEAQEMHRQTVAHFSDPAVMLRMIDGELTGSRRHGWIKHVRDYRRHVRRAGLAA